jgi:IclR family acetate operon transcriptional repressor
MICKNRGYATDLEEHHIGIQCIAVPVLNMHSQCIASISVSCPTNLVSTEDLETTVLSALRETGELVSRGMGYIS